jgi:hypothetical protein
MATMLKRRLKKLLEKDETPVTLNVSRPEGNVSFTKREVQR